MDNNNAPLGGEFPIEARAVYTHSSVLTSIAATVHREQTIIFLGDEGGQLKKVHIISKLKMCHPYMKILEYVLLSKLPSSLLLLKLSTVYEMLG